MVCRFYYRCATDFTCITCLRSPLSSNMCTLMCFFVVHSFVLLISFLFLRLIYARLNFHILRLLVGKIMKCLLYDMGFNDTSAVVLSYLSFRILLFVVVVIAAAAVVVVVVSVLVCALMCT